MNWWQWTLTIIFGWILMAFLTYSLMILTEYWLDVDNKDKISLLEYIYDEEDDRKTECLFSFFFPFGLAIIIIAIVRSYLDGQNIFHPLLKFIFRKRYLLNRVSKEI